MASGFNFGGGYTPAYGGIPGVPDPTSSAAGAIAGNSANLPGIEGITGSIDTANQAQLEQNYNMAIPNYAALTQQASNVTGQELNGQVPQDVISQLLQQAAERGIMTGGAGSPNTNAAYLRALGLTSLGQQQTGMGNLSQIIQEAPKAPLMDASSLFVTADQEQQANAARELYASAPIPSAAAAAAKSAATVPSTSPQPWWAQGAGYAGWLGTGTTSNGAGTYHTPSRN
jgi:hypothetical protein